MECSDNEEKINMETGELEVIRKYGNYIKSINSSRDRKEMIRMAG